MKQYMKPELEYVDFTMEEISNESGNVPVNPSDVPSDPNID